MGIGRDKFINRPDIRRRKQKYVKPEASCSFDVCCHLPTERSSIFFFLVELSSRVAQRNDYGDSSETVFLKRRILSC